MIGSDPNAAVAVVTVRSAQPPNLLTNPGLENGSTGWEVSKPKVAQPQDYDVTPHSGSNAVHYWNGTDFSDATVTQTVYNVPDGTYTFSAWIDGDAKESAAVPYLFATGFDQADPLASVKIDMVPAGWNNFKLYRVQVPVTSGQVTLGVNVNGAAGAWGDVDDFYFGLPTGSDAAIQALPVTAAARGVPLSGSAVVPANAQITLSSDTEGAVIYYTTDGSDPGYASNSSTTLVYYGPLSIHANTVLKTMALKPGYSNSPVNVYRITTDESTTSGLIPNGSFEQAGSLGVWTLAGVTAGSADGSYVFDSVQDSADGKVYAGAGYFNYWSKDAYSFKLSQTVTGLANGIYTMSARSAGKSNKITNAAGRATNDPAVATVTVAAVTPDGEKKANVVNQGQAGSDWHNVWETFTVPDIRVTDGSMTVAFSAQGSADYWGYLDRVTLIKTGELPGSPGASGDSSTGGSEPTAPPATVEHGEVIIKPVTDGEGAASVSLKAEEVRAAVGSAAVHYDQSDAGGGDESRFREHSGRAVPCR